MSDYVVYLTYRLVAGSLGRLPPRVGYWLATQVGALLYRFYPGLRRVVTHNTRHVLGPDAAEEQVQAVVRDACVNIAKGHFDLLRMPRLTVEKITAMTQIEGIEFLQDILARGQGIVVFSAHLGNVDLVGQLPMAYGLKISGAVEHIRPERLFRYLLRVRQSHGVTLIPSDEPMLGLFRALKRGEIVALPCDRAIGGNGREIEFFGAPTRLPDGPVRVALRTGSPLVPVFVRRLPDDTFCVIVEPPLDVPRTDDLEVDVGTAMEKVIGSLERHIGSRPEQWLVASPVWPMEEPEG